MFCYESLALFLCYFEVSWRSFDVIIRGLLQMLSKPSSATLAGAFSDVMALGHLSCSLSRTFTLCSTTAVSYTELANANTNMVHVCLFPISKFSDHQMEHRVKVLLRLQLRWCAAMTSLKVPASGVPASFTKRL